MNKLITNPVFIVLVGSILTGIGVDIKLSTVLIPGITILFIGLYLGLARVFDIRR